MNQLPLPLQWIVEGGFWPTFLVCLTITPILPQVLGVVFCSYWAPLRPSRQFYAYFPGDVFLALFVAGVSTTFKYGGFYIPTWLNIAIMVGALAFYVALTRMDRVPYTKSQIWSANKAYHNVLYFWYGYLAVACFSAMWWTDASVLHKVVVTLPGLVWLGYMVIDNFVSKERKAARFAQAHADNMPIWKTGWRLRKFNQATGRYEVPWGPRRDPFSTLPYFRS